MWQQIKDITGARNVEAARYRWAALGFVKTCSRCGGGGKFSYNQIHGDKCYGCSGSGKQLVTPTEKRIEEARRLVEAGKLAPYLAMIEAERARARHEKALRAELDQHLGAIEAAYDAAYRAEYHAHEMPSETCQMLRSWITRAYDLRTAARAEHPDVAQIRAAAQQLRAEWDAR
jgi:hypothetical protein